MKVILVVTDGIGCSEKTTYNAFFHAKKPTYDYLFDNVPYGMIDTFGLSVGLPKGQMGNSEVGHMCMGAGRVLYQDLVKISLAIENDELRHNLVLLELSQNVKNVHLCGLLSDGGVHSHLSHIIALAKIFASMDKKVYLHLITDGRDVLPQSALGYLEQIDEILSPNIQIASISGRFYAMDRDKRWERIQQAYEAMALAYHQTPLSPKAYIQSQYEQGIFDEFIVPASFKDYQGMNNGEGSVFANFRSDRAREIVDAIANPAFKEFERIKSFEIKTATMTEYDAKFPYPILFPKTHIHNTLAEIISLQGLRQLHTAETEKYAHVTFFFNGGREELFEGEERVLIPSPQVKTYDLQPQMSAKEVGDAVIKGIEEGFDFIVVNFANGDMVGHTGNFDAAIKAVEAVDKELGRILESAKKHQYALFITSDHGNCEEMKDEQGHTLTNHTVGKVWCFGMIEGVDKIQNGGLNNIAPSVLKAMQISIPPEMDKPLF